MPLNIIVVGAGIAGLAASIGLSRHGHKVTVFERRAPGSADGEGGAGIQLQPNVSLVLERWGMLDDLRRVAHDSLMSDLRVVEVDGNGDGKVRSIVKMNFKDRGFAWYSSRRAFRDVFRQVAVSLGVKIKEGCRVVDIDIEAPSIVLQDGSKVVADLIIGADGSGSQVRRTLYPSYRPAVTNKASFHVVLPLPVVEQDEKLKHLLDGVHNVITCAPERFIFTSPFPYENLVDFQLADYEYDDKADPNPHLISERVWDLTWLRGRFDAFGSMWRRALEMAQTTFKWRMVEVTGLPSWSGGSGKVVLIADAAHAMLPFSGQGSAMGIEDAAALSELLARSRSGDGLRPLLALYEDIRRPRCEKAHRLAQIQGAIWAMKDPEKIRARNERWQTMNDPAYLSAVPDPDAQYGSPAFQKWLDKYDIFEAVRQELHRSERLPTKL